MTRNFSLVFQPVCPQMEFICENLYWAREPWYYYIYYNIYEIYIIIFINIIFILTFIMNHTVIAAGIISLIVTMCWSPC